MTNRQRSIGSTMRPNIQISHQLNGRVKDWAAEHELTTEQAYRLIIEAGIDVLGIPEVDVELVEEDARAAFSCPDCGETFDLFQDLHEHVQSGECLE